MKVLSLFDGISCARVALERAGIPVEVYYASEIDKYAIQISQKNYPDIIKLPDVRQIETIKRFDSQKEPYYFKENIDILIGGSPCQDLSIAKKDRKGLDGERSGLFYEYVRILKEVKPKYFILENVASMPKEAKEIITKELGVEPIMINAALVSAQNRKRLFWVGKLDEFGTYQKVEISQPEDKGILLKDILEENVDEKYFLNDKNIKHLQREFGSKGKIVNMDDKSPTITDSAGMGGGNQTCVRIGQLNSGGQGDRIYSIDGKSTSLSALGGGGGAKTGLYAVSQRGRHIVNGKRRDILGAKTEQRIEIGQTDKAHCITSVQKDSMIMQNTIIRKLTPIECERLQSLPDNYTGGISNTQRYKCLGNAFNVDVIAHILSFIKN